MRDYLLTGSGVAGKMFGSAVTWLQIITVGALAVLTKEYFFLRNLLQDAKNTGICEVCALITS